MLGIKIDLIFRNILILKCVIYLFNNIILKNVISFFCVVYNMKYIY